MGQIYFVLENFYFSSGVIFLSCKGIYGQKIRGGEEEVEEGKKKAGEGGRECSCAW